MHPLPQLKPSSNVKYAFLKQETWNHFAGTPAMAEAVSFFNIMLQALIMTAWNPIATGATR